MTAPVHIRYVRSGGFGGLRMTADVDTTQPDHAAVAARIEQLTAAVLAEPAAAKAATGMRDGFQYDLTFETAAGERSLRASDPLQSKALQQLVEILDGLSAPTKRGR